MAQGMRHGRSELPARGTGKADENDGAACTAGKAWQPMLWLSVKPKMPLTWLCVTSLRVAVVESGRVGYERKGAWGRGGEKKNQRRVRH